MTNEEFIIINKEKDPRSLALKKMPEGVDALWCLRQIEGYQLARKKLPRWSEEEGLWYPPRLSMEQCSSEATALHKRSIIRELMAEQNATSFSITDITGGFGVDFSYMAQGAAQATYIEQQEELCRVATHNMPLLGLPQARIINANEATEAMLPTEGLRIIFADPARRDDAGRKTVAIEDCTPDICRLQDFLLHHCHYLIVKLSPMLDITQALRALGHVCLVHVVSVRGECKELLFVLSSPYLNDKPSVLRYHCINTETIEASFTCSEADIQQGRTLLSCSLPRVGQKLLEPNASILKAGVQEAFAQHYGLQKIHSHSNLYLTDHMIDNIPARQFIIKAVCDFSKPSIKEHISPLKKANLTIRNFPSTVAELRKRLKLKEGGSDYIFATTLQDDSHALLICEKA